MYLSDKPKKLFGYFFYILQRDNILIKEVLKLCRYYSKNCVQFQLKITVNIHLKNFVFCIFAKACF